MTQILTTKTCTKCNEEFPATLTFFHTQKGGKHGLCACCRKCRQAEKLRSRYFRMRFRSGINRTMLVELLDHLPRAPENTCSICESATILVPFIFSGERLCSSCFASQFSILKKSAKALIRQHITAFDLPWN